MNMSIENHEMQREVFSVVSGASLQSYYEEELSQLMWNEDSIDADEKSAPSGFTAKRHAQGRADLLIREGECVDEILETLDDEDICLYLRL